MISPSDPYFRRDLLKLFFMGTVLCAGGWVVFTTSALVNPTLLSVVVALLFGPVVTALERRGISRAGAIAIIFGTLGLALTLLVMWGTEVLGAEIAKLRETGPEYGTRFVRRMSEIEAGLKLRYPVLENIALTQTLVGWGHGTGEWLKSHGGALLGQVLSLSFLVPIFSFALLHDGKTIRKAVLQLVPNRFFELGYLLSSKVLTSLADYLRAKLIEAALVGGLTVAGLYLVGAPFALVLGIVAGVTNIVPYLGPVLGAIPGILLALVEPSYGHLLFPIFLVYLVVNLIDTVFIFPVIVAKLVNLHPVILLAAVTVGQEYYGVVGMLLSIPIAASVKVIIQEVYAVIYDRTVPDRRENAEEPVAA